MEIKKRRRRREEASMKWWKMKKNDGKIKFRNELRQALGGSEELPDNLATTAKVVRKTAKKSLL